MQTANGQAEIKVRVRRNPRNLLRKLVLSVITVYIALVAYGFIKEIVVARLVNVEQVQSGVLQSSFTAEGILVRTEETVSSPRNGTIRRIAAEGERVRVGQVVAQVAVASLDSSNGETRYNIKAPKAGIVSYRIDGLESVYSYENLKELDLIKVEKLIAEYSEIKSDGVVEEGKPVFRIINNLDPVYIIATPQNGQKLPEKQDSFQITSGSGDKLFKATLAEKNFFGKPNQILLRVANYDNGLMVLRKIKFDVVTERHEGHIIPISAIVKKEEKEGIYTIYKERVKWKPVEVEGKSEDKAVISGITPDTQVILSPEYVEEGVPLHIR